MLRNYKILIEYDGNAFHGWQRQKSDRTIQQEIEHALSTMAAGQITLNGSGRTDAGVHAWGQVANFLCETDLAPEVFLKSLNSLLPDDIVIKDCRLADRSFHARYDVKSKIYHYQILNRSIPKAVGRQYAWFIRRKLDTTAMRSAISHLVGRHDFKSFEGTGSPRSHTTREVIAADLIEEEDGAITFKIEADGFLRYMVRNIVGTLVDVGLGKISPADVKNILESKDRRNASPTAPPHGLFLMEVKY